MSHSYAIVGAGGRGQRFSQWLADHPGAGRVIAVADPRPERRAAVADRHQIDPAMQFESWEHLLDQPCLADALINTTMDQLHAPSSVKALQLGYHMLLEKPMATTMEDCVAINRAAQEAGTVVALWHSMRHHVVYARMQQLIADGAIGQPMSFDHLEAVGHLHYTHSFLRGNWAREAESTFMLLAKSCHDVDLMTWLMDRPCRSVGSFGALSYFRPENAPEGATPRCTDGCPHEPTCPYSAIKLYIDDEKSWFGTHLGFDQLATREEKLEVLRNTRFGQCVWQCDNDVVDHQVVSFEYEDDITGTFTMTAFGSGRDKAYGGARFTRIHGTEGWLRADTATHEICLHRFTTDTHETLDVPPQEGGHGGADDNLMANFVEALHRNDPAHVLTGPVASLLTHRIVFAAEKARREHRLVDVDELPLT